MCLQSSNAKHIAVCSASILTKSPPRHKYPNNKRINETENRRQHPHPFLPQKKKKKKKEREKEKKKQQQLQKLQFYRHEVISPRRDKYTGCS